MSYICSVIFKGVSHTRTAELKLKPLLELTVSTRNRRRTDRADHARTLQRCSLALARARSAGAL